MADLLHLCVWDMSLFLANDDPATGAPNAIGDQRETMCLLAPLSCTPIPGSAPPALSFHRIHYTWLALSLASSGDGDTPASFLENFYYGTHTLTWPAMHAIISRAIASGFNVP